MRASLLLLAQDSVLSPNDLGRELVWWIRCEFRGDSAKFFYVGGRWFNVIRHRRKDAQSGFERGEMFGHMR